MGDFLSRRIAIENFDQSLVQLIQSLASFLIHVDLYVRRPDEFVALPVDDLESQSPFADKACSGLLRQGPPSDYGRLRKSERECVRIVVQKSRIYLPMAGRVVGDEQISVLGLDLGESFLIQLMIPDAHNVLVKFGVAGRGPLDPSISLGAGEIRALVEINRYLLSQTIEGGQKDNRHGEDI